MTGVRIKAFETVVPGKWVLAGEHSVLAGAPAVALPHPEYGLSFMYEPAEAPGFIYDPPEVAPVISDLLGLLKSPECPCRPDFAPPGGVVRVRSTIPVGAGLGSSAAFCVALARWILSDGRHAEDGKDSKDGKDGMAGGTCAVAHLARHFEDKFHGRSSGMDVAVVSAGVPVLFSMNDGARPLAGRVGSVAGGTGVGVGTGVSGDGFLPRFSFHDTGLRASTRECVARVQRFRDCDPERAGAIDRDMAGAACAALRGLEVYAGGGVPGGGDDGRAGGLRLVAGAMKTAHGCFEAWGLVPDAARRLIDRLYGEGALAAKLTGAGAGGFVVALRG